MKLSLNLQNSNQIQRFYPKGRALALIKSMLSNHVNIQGSQEMLSLYSCSLLSFSLGYIPLC